MPESVSFETKITYHPNAKQVHIVISLFHLLTPCPFEPPQCPAAAVNVQSNRRTSKLTALAQPLMAMDKSIGFIGAGQMAEALARGFITKGVVNKERIHAADPVATRQAVFRGLGANAQDNGVEVKRQRAPIRRKGSLNSAAPFERQQTADSARDAAKRRAPRAPPYSSNETPVNGGAIGHVDQSTGGQNAPLAPHLMRDRPRCTRVGTVHWHFAETIGY